METYNEYRRNSHGLFIVIRSRKQQYNFKDKIMGISRIDERSIPLIDPYRWVFGKKSKYITARYRSTGERLPKSLSLHRLIAFGGELRALYDKQIVDHKNRNKLCNTIHNLRVINNSKNTHNTDVHKLKGYSYHPRCKTTPYRAVIMIEGKREIIGWYTTPEEANKAYIRRKKQITFPDTHY